MVSILIVSLFIALLTLLAIGTRTHLKNRDLLPDEPSKDDEVHFEGVEGAMDESLIVKFKRNTYPYKEIELLLLRQQKEAWDVMSVSERNDFVKLYDKHVAEGKIKKF